MTREASRVSDATFEELRRHFDEGEVIEIACVVGVFNYFNRFNEALHVAPTGPGEGVES